MNGEVVLKKVLFSLWVMIISRGLFSPVRAVPQEWVCLFTGDGWMLSLSAAEGCGFTPHAVKIKGSDLLKRREGAK